MSTVFGVITGVRPRWPFVGRVGSTVNATPKPVAKVIVASSYTRNRLGSATVLRPLAKRIAPRFAPVIIATYFPQRRVGSSYIVTLPKAKQPPREIVVASSYTRKWVGSAAVLRPLANRVVPTTKPVAKVIVATSYTRKLPGSATVLHTVPKRVIVSTPVRVPTVVVASYRQLVYPYPARVGKVRINPVPPTHKTVVIYANQRVERLRRGWVRVIPIPIPRGVTPPPPLLKPGVVGYWDYPDRKGTM